LLSARRHALVAQSEALRARLLESAAQTGRSLRVAALAASAAQALRRHPAVLVGGAVALVVVGPRRLVRIAGIALGAWTVLMRARTVAGLARRFGRGE
jgi:hypothetical protein